MADDSLGDISRRNFVKTAGTGALAALAGCSTQDDGGGEGSTDSGSDYTETSEESSTSDREGTTTGTEDESSGESSIVNGEDEIHEGEEWYEGFLDEHNFYWIELEQPSSQTENVAEANSMTEDSDFRYAEQMLTENKASVDGEPSHTVDLDTVYIAFPGEESDEASRFSILGLVESEYNEGGGFGKKNGQYSLGLEDVTLEEMEGFLDKHVTGYSDLSDSLPDEYQELVAE